MPTSWALIYFGDFDFLNGVLTADFVTFAVYIGSFDLFGDIGFAYLCCITCLLLSCVSVGGFVLRTC